MLFMQSISRSIQFMPGQLLILFDSAKYFDTSFDRWQKTRNKKVPCSECLAMFHVIFKVDESAIHLVSPHLKLTRRSIKGLWSSSVYHFDFSSKASGPK